MSQLGTYPPFVLGKPRFDQSTFTGRLKHFLDIVDPRTLFTTKKQLESALQLLEDYRQAKISPDITNEQLWKAQKIKQAIIHPDTEEKIFMPFRMSGYVPFGSVMVVGLLLPNPTFGQMIFWQWMNQSHNAAVNYANRNATKPTPLSRFLMGYAGAVSAAIGIAVGLSALLKKANNFSAATKSLIQKFVPFPAVAVANVCNLFLMRNNELLEGIEVKNKEGDVVGTSIKAARKAVIETAVTRVVLPAPLLIIPPIILTQLERMAFWSRIPRLRLPIHAAICTITFGVSLPVAIALFPQQSKISTSKLEPEIREKTTDSLLYYNKGL